MPTFEQGFDSLTPHQKDNKMFPPEILIIFNAITALSAAEQGDPRFEVLVERLMEKCFLDREQVIRNIVGLAEGNVNL